MAVHLSFVLILTGLTGVHSITMVSRLSVKSRASITIPCPYESQYWDNVKYLCKGTNWLTCSTEIRTDKQSSRKFTISDDKIQSIFTVTIKDLTDEDTGYYWCAVEIDNDPDVRTFFYLSVTRGLSSLYVDHQEVTGFKEEKITITCYHSKPGEAKWCRLGRSCVTGPFASMDGTAVVAIKSDLQSFTVTMSGLKLESSGWYYCVKGDLQMPVHVTVTERPTTTTHATTRGFSTLSPTPDLIPVTGDEPTTKVETKNRSASVYHKSLIISLSLLILTVMVALLIWCIIKKHKQTKAESSATTMKEAEVTYSTVKQKRKTSSQNEEDATYCNVAYKRQSSGQRSCAESDVDVMYTMLSGHSLIMTAHVTFLLILTGLTGIHSITTVSKVSVRTGGSVSIPCFYESEYKNHVKYLCKGAFWVSCSSVVKTNQHSSSGKFSISDDQSQRIFTVTIKDVTDKDTDYWCIVEMNDGPDYGKHFQLSVTGATPSLYVDHQEVTGFKGGNITISCRYSNPGVIEWCKLGSFCVTGPSGSIDGTTVTINASVPNVFTVTMHGLMSSSWYYCVNGDLQMPVHVTVNEQPITTTRLLSTFSPTTEPLFPDDSWFQDGKDSAPVDLKLYIIPLSLLIVIVMVILFIWFMLRRCMQTEADSSATTTAEQEVTYSIVKTKKTTSDRAEEEVTYSNVNHMTKTSDKVEANDDDVTYSRLAQHEQNL
ncbi:uncharacterized protein LOC131993910 [Centropristis striata]|uniref:uncharacterized protein LOC131993910 n=1 Tax=Centropristis striata TaxID=184440 RepID=UPI0027E03FF7|nr:uncharacterized protein LOC131993910 [Centropristis striata]